MRQPPTVATCLDGFSLCLKAVVPRTCIICFLAEPQASKRAGLTKLARCDKPSKTSDIVIDDHLDHHFGGKHPSSKSKSRPQMLDVSFYRSLPKPSHHLSPCLGTRLKSIQPQQRLIPRWILPCQVTDQDLFALSHEGPKKSAHFFSWTTETYVF